MMNPQLCGKYGCILLATHALSESESSKDHVGDAKIEGFSIPFVDLASLAAMISSHMLNSGNWREEDQPAYAQMFSKVWRKETDKLARIQRITEERDAHESSNS